MSDVRTLLKAKRQEIRIDHPLASYTSSGQLRCIICETNIKHPSAWDGHLGSKAHRTNAVRVREEERRRKEFELEDEAKRLKRKIPEDGVDEDVGSAAKKSKVIPQSSKTSGLPSYFFSDQSKAPLLLINDSEDEDELEETVTGVATAVGGPADLSGFEREWLEFQQSVINAPDEAIAYDHATIVAEPQLVSDQPEGFPAHDVETHTQPSSKGDEDERRRKEQEERELIMDRLMDEERAQEEADMKVIAMKNKLEALRKRRKAFRSAEPDMGVA